MSGNNELHRTIRRLNVVGLATVAILVLGVGGWAAVAQLSGAVIAPGFVVVESNVKKVQHPSGGIVGQIFVKDGSRVKKGEVIVRLDDTVPRANLGILRSQLDEILARQARLTAERDNAEAVSFPEELTTRADDTSIATAIVGEQKLFESRRHARTGQRSLLQERVAQITEEIRGLSSQRKAKESEIDLIGQELKGVRALYAKNLVSIMRFMALQRDHAKLEGEHGQLGAEIARSRGRISEIELQIIQLEKDFSTEVLKELRELEGKIAELKERMIAAADQLRRIDIRSPQSGTVLQLSVHTVGGVIGAGDTIMLIVPRADQLVVEARVAPVDIDQVVQGAPVQVRIMAGNQRTTPSVNGIVTHIAADLTREAATTGQPGQAYFLTRVSITEESRKNLGDLKLVPGMPAEAMIETGMRTPLEFVLKPLQEQIARTFRER
ncbi:MAG: HlyD family type I secretion periplasmic adaptor subunit [Rhizobiales bacterium]|nr:HlyD family type I secretion periplasmic adaptor subunit [Hyphomicrobiales bacterium]